MPEQFAFRVGLRIGPADMELDDGRLVVRPNAPSRLDELLAGVTAENLHAEWADGPPAGAEWRKSWPS